MTTLDPKVFIKNVFIDELGSMINEHPYISFILMGVGIEFLGKCNDKSLASWNVSGRSKMDFENAVKNLPGLQNYESYLTTCDLYGSLRCGLAHAASPKFSITLSSKLELGHLVEDNGRLNLKVEDFYSDFKTACEFVISDSYPTGNKMEIPFLQIPDPDFISGSLNAVSGTTYTTLS